MARRLVVLGLLGTSLDRGPRAGDERGVLRRRGGRWEGWRPTVSLFQHEDLRVDRLELLHDPRAARLAAEVAGDVRHVSPETEVRLRPFALKDPWDFEEVYGALHDLALAYPFDTDREDYLVHITTGTHVAQICLFLLTEARYLPARLLQTGPPSPRSSGGPGSYQVIDLDLSRYDRLAARFRRERREGLSFLKSGIATRNAAFNALVERIERVALASSGPILLTGPTGAGKSLLARRIYELKRARHQVTGPFVEVNGATIRGDGAMSALFGHERGAYTGALERRGGLLRAAGGGVLFLDEVGELGAEEQAMLLRALEERRFRPVGADREVESDFQLLAGTNRDLRADVRAGRFREDLLARIDVWTFRLPPLRERLEDLEPNLDFELAQHAQRSGQAVRFARGAREAFLSFALAREAVWAGNFRDLSGAVTRMATLAEGGHITRGLVQEEIGRLADAWGERGTGDARPDGGESLLEKVMGTVRAGALDRFDAVQLADVLAVCRRARSLSEAGRLLFSESRKAKAAPNDADRLRKYLARHGLTWADVSEGGSRPRA